VRRRTGREDHPFAASITNSRWRSHLVRNLIYPVPDPNLPFLGVRFTPMMEAHRGWARRRARLSARRLSVQQLLAARRAGNALLQRLLENGPPLLEDRRGEMYRSLSKHFLAFATKLVPAVGFHDIVRAGAVFEHAVDGDGKLLDDFRIVTADRMIHAQRRRPPRPLQSRSAARLPICRCELY
jgi:L-2-hydroxyglutarate oxidase